MYLRVLGRCRECLGLDEGDHQRRHIALVANMKSSHAEVAE